MMPPSPLPRIGLVMGVRNEDRFLAAHFAYHRMIGVEQVYLFLDRSTDGTEHIATHFPGVRVFRLAENPEAGGYVCEFHRLAMDQAMDVARKDGLDWLMILDPDEYAYAENLGTTDSESGMDLLIKDADLRTMLSAVDEDILQVRLATREVLPCAEYAEAGFAAQVFFHGDHPVPRLIVDPLTGTSRLWSDFLGHRQGKCLVRTSALVQGYDSHCWTTDQSASRPSKPEYAPIPTRNRGWHGHYFITGQRHFLDKFRQISWEPQYWPCGTPVEFPVQTYRTLSKHLDDFRINLPDYLRDHVFYREAELLLLQEENRVVRDTRLKRLIAEALRRFPLSPRPLNAVNAWKLSAWQTPALPVRGPENYELSPARLPPDDLAGFHSVELYQNTLFRWSEPAASIRLNLPEGVFCLEGQLGSWIDPTHARTLIPNFCGQSLHPNWSEEAGYSFTSLITVGPAAGGDNILQIQSAGLSTDSPETRRLSLPWIRLRACRQPSKKHSFRHLLGSIASGHKAIG